MILNKNQISIYLILIFLISCVNSNHDSFELLSKKEVINEKNIQFRGKVTNTKDFEIPQDVGLQILELVKENYQEPLIRGRMETDQTLQSLEISTKQSIYKILFDSDKNGKIFCLYFKYYSDYYTYYGRNEITIEVYKKIDFLIKN